MKSGSNFFQQKHRNRRVEVSSKQVAVKIHYEINQDKKGSKYIDVNSFATQKNYALKEGREIKVTAMKRFNTVFICTS